MRINLLLVLLFVGIIVAGCSNDDKGVIDDPINEQNLVVIRSFSDSSLTLGETITVTLIKRIPSGEMTLLTEENVPQGLTIINAGSGTVIGNTIRWAELKNSESGTFTYTVKVDGDLPGVWSGQYSLNGELPKNIGGLTKI